MSNSSTPVANRRERTARLRWVAIAQMKVSPLAQRELNPARVNKIAAAFDPEQVGNPTVNFRDGHYYIIDGQHRVRAMEAMGWADQSIQCWTYVDLSEQEEAEMFLKINDVLALRKFDKFRIAIQSGREVETEIDRVVRLQSLCISESQQDGAIKAVGALEKVYNAGGAKTLGRTLRILRDAYGSAGMAGPLIEGVGLVCQRYNGQLDDQVAVEKLNKRIGGVQGLMGPAEQLRRKTGNTRPHCIAAACVEILNAGKGGKKLPDWWKS